VGNWESSGFRVTLRLATRTTPFAFEFIARSIRDERCGYGGVGQLRVFEIHPNVEPAVRRYGIAFHHRAAARQQVRGRYRRGGAPRIRNQDEQIEVRRD
jgi:hypothetical protein